METSTEPCMQLLESRGQAVRPSVLSGGAQSPGSKTGHQVGHRVLHAPAAVDTFALSILVALGLASTFPSSSKP
eukprot:1158490-Pelagomonas_calceolata.AAC.1